jgi:outer membrane protein OmpA-like peptidoglycan-associated protein
VSLPEVFGASSSSEEGSWMSISDLMSGLMVIFLFILIAYIRPIIEKHDNINEIAKTWVSAHDEIYAALKSEFERDLVKWRAELEAETLTLRFSAPEVLFAQASAELAPEFNAILSNFFPRYVRVLSQFDSGIEEIRIEGHTSSEWQEGSTEDEAYFANMALSQDRTRTVLEYGLGVLTEANEKEWARRHLTANGMSSSRRIFSSESKLEDKDASRRVDFRVVTNAKKALDKIVEAEAAAAAAPDISIRP